jgi:hypothetical protein
MSCRLYALGIRDETTNEKLYHEDTLNSLSFLQVQPPIAKSIAQKILRSFKFQFGVVYHNLGVYLRLLAMAFVAEPEFQLELDYALHSTPMIIRHIICFW